MAGHPAPESGSPGDLGVRAPLPGDEAFLREVYRSSRADEFASAGWSEAQFRTFCDNQFDAQAAGYAAAYPGNRVLVVCAGDVRIGRVIEAWTPDGLYLLDFAILPPYRNRGYGSALLRRTQGEARAAGTSVVVHVDWGSAALALYRRHGFVTEAQDAVRATLRWNAGCA